MRHTLMICCAWAGILLAKPALAGEMPFNILVGEPSWVPEAQLIARALDHENGLRILPMLGKGAVQSVQDLQDFPIIDAALITTDSLAYTKGQNLLAPDESKITYVVAIKQLPILLVTRRSVANVTALAGKKIATGAADTASFASGELLLGSMEVPFLRIAQSQESAVDALLQGRADAALFVGLPMNIEKLGNNFHALPLVMPEQLAQIYKPAHLTSKDAVNLVLVGQQLDTVSTSLILAVNEVSSTPDHRKALKAFEDGYFHQPLGPTALDDLSALPRETIAAALIKQLPPTITPTGAKP